ncbi:unnamed protein product [Brassica rapa subsp. narinosa]
MMFSSSLCWMNWKFYHLHLPISRNNPVMSLTPLVISISRFFISLSVLLFVILGVMIFPSIRCVSPVCEPRFSADDSPSAFSFGVVFAC